MKRWRTREGEEDMVQKERGEGSGDTGEKGSRQQRRMRRRRNPMRALNDSHKLRVSGRGCRRRKECMIG